MLSPCQSPPLFPNNLNSVNVGPWKTATKNTTQKNSPSKFWIDSEREWERIRESRHLSTHISGTWSWPTQCWTLSHMEATSASLFESSRWAKLTARGESHWYPECSQPREQQPRFSAAVFLLETGILNNDYGCLLRHIYYQERDDTFQ